MRTTIRVTATTILLGAAIAACFMTRAGRPGEFHVRRVEFSAVTELGDDRKLVGLADNVFFGEVLAKSGEWSDEDGSPETQFSVRFLESIKGSLQGVVTVNQEGGYFARTGELVLMEGDMLLEPGSRYLFATRTFEAKGWHTLVPGFGDIRLTSAQQRDELRARFSQAKANEIPLG